MVGVRNEAKVAAVLVWTALPAHRRPARRKRAACIMMTRCEQRKEEERDSKESGNGLRLVILFYFLDGGSSTEDTKRLKLLDWGNVLIIRVRAGLLQTSSLQPVMVGHDNHKKKSRTHAVWGGTKILRGQQGKLLWQVRCKCLQARCSGPLIMGRHRLPGGWLNAAFQRCGTDLLGTWCNRHGRDV